MRSSDPPPHFEPPSLQEISMITESDYFEDMPDDAPETMSVLNECVRLAVENIWQLLRIEGRVIARSLEREQGKNTTQTGNARYELATDHLSTYSTPATSRATSRGTSRSSSLVSSRRTSFASKRSMDSDGDDEEEEEAVEEEEEAVETTDDDNDDEDNDEPLPRTATRRSLRRSSSLSSLASDLSRQVILEEDEDEEEAAGNQGQLQVGGDNDDSDESEEFQPGMDLDDGKRKRRKKAWHL